MADERQERWAISATEEGGIADLNSADELIGTWTETDEDAVAIGDTWQVVVLRDGTVTNRSIDGTVGVPHHVRQYLGDEDTLYHSNDTGGLEETQSWVDVVVAPDGSFVRLAEELTPSLRM